MPSVFIYWCFTISITLGTNLSLIGSSSLPKANHAMSIGYDNTTNVIWLIGGYWYDGDTLISFDLSIWNETNVFQDHGTVLYPDEFQCTGQTYVQRATNVYATNPRDEHQLYIFDISTRDVKTVHANGLELYDYGCLASVGDWIIYTFFNKTYILTISDQSWSSSGNPKMLEQRWYHSCLIEPNEGYLYVIGGAPGYNSIEKLYVNDITNIDQYGFILLTDTLSHSKWYIRSILYKTDIYIIGGNAAEWKTYDDIDLLDTTTDSVRLWGTLSIAVGSAASIIIDSRVYVFGGMDGNDAVDSWQYFDVLSAFNIYSSVL